MKRIAIFASGNGSNAENIARYFMSHPDAATVSLIVTNRPGARVIDRARHLGIPAEILSREQINDQATMLPLLQDHSIDIIVLAGFLMMVPAYLIDRYRGFIVNIHPSLLPKYGGKGMYGRHVHEAVVANRETETGITVHHVSEQCDEGRVIFRASVAVSPDDTPETVERKIHDLERLHFPRVIHETFCR